MIQPIKSIDDKNLILNLKQTRTFSIHRLESIGSGKNQRQVTKNISDRLINFQFDLHNTSIKRLLFTVFYYNQMKKNGGVFSRQ